jgi:hypothetical protein
MDFMASSRTICSAAAAPLAGFVDADYGRAGNDETQVASGSRMADEPDCTDRRKLMLTALSAAALTLGTSASAQPKMTRQQAEYQDEPKGILMCGTCTLFIPPAECKVVEGFVALTGWCNAFDLAD